MYDQPVKKHCRTRLIKHAIKSLTTERSTSVCVKRDHVRRVWQQLHETNEAQTFYPLPSIRVKIEEEIKNWEKFHDSQVQTRKASDLRVCYLCGDNPLNDLKIFVENGVLCQNVWAIEKDRKVLEEAWINVAKSNMRNIRLFKGDLLTCLKDLEGQFDIIYFDACGTLPSTKQKTLKAIGYIFLYNKLTSPGALITNFSFPPEQKEPLDEKHETERESFEHLAKEFLQYRLWNTVHQECNDYEELRAQEIDSRSIDDNYGDYVTFQVIDSAYLYIPAYRMLSSEKQSLWDQIFVDKKDFLEAVKEADWSQEINEQVNENVCDNHEIESWCLQHLGATIENCNRCIPCKTWVNEIFPDWKNSKFKKDKLFCLILTHLLSYNPVFIFAFGNEDVHKRCKEGCKNSRTISFCDPITPEYFLSLIVGILYGQMAYPSFPVIDKSLRLKYIANERQMFSDVLIFDKCRYLYEHFPSILFVEFAMKEPWQQMVFRMVADGLRKHIGFLFNDMFRFCHVASINPPTSGGTGFPGSQPKIPEREVLDFENFIQNGKRKFKEAMESYDACQQLCPNDVRGYINKASCALKMNMLEVVLANCEKALKLEPNNVEALYVQAMAWKAQKEYGKAKQNLFNILLIEDNAEAQRELEEITHSEYLVRYNTLTGRITES